MPPAEAEVLSLDPPLIDALIAEDYVGFDFLGNPQDKAMTADAYTPGAARLDKHSLAGVAYSVIGSVGIISGKGYIHGKCAGSECEHSLRFLDICIHRKGRRPLSLSQVTPLGAA